MRTLYFYHEIEDMYEELLNECHEPVSICGHNYDQGSALRNLDPIAFRCGVSEWESKEFYEVRFDNMTDEEKKHYAYSADTTMYCRKEEEE